MKKRLSRKQVWYRSNYLRSTHWQRVKQQVIARDGYYCSIRGCKLSSWRRYFIPLDFHHLSYTRINTEEEYKDVVIVCRIHHMLCHYRLTKKIALERSSLAKRYFALSNAKWRRTRPSDIITYIISLYRL